MIGAAEGSDSRGHPKAPCPTGSGFNVLANAVPIRFPGRSVRSVPMKVLIATVTVGAGHTQAAAALEEAWREGRSRDAVLRLDVLDFTPRLHRQTYAEGYVRLVEHAPALWGMLFNTTDNPARVRQFTRLRRALARLPAERFVREVKRFQPDAVLCTHFLPLEIMGRLEAKARRGPAPFTVSIVTDFEAHALWMEPVVDLYCVAAEETTGAFGGPRRGARGCRRHGHSDRPEVRSRRGRRGRAEAAGVA